MSDFRCSARCTGPGSAKSITAAEHLFFMSGRPPRGREIELLSCGMELCPCHFFCDIGDADERVHTRRDF